MNFLSDIERREVEKSAAQYDAESEADVIEYNKNPIPQSTHLQDLYELFIKEERDTIGHHQEWISLLISLKEGKGLRSPIYQMCDVYLNMDKTYLAAAVESLNELRRNHERP